MCQKVPGFILGARKAYSGIKRFFSLVVAFIILDPASAVENDALLWNSAPSRVECPDESTFLWVTHSYGTDCIRYFSSDGLSGASMVIVLLSGDRDAAMRLPVDQIPNNNRAARENIVKAISDVVGQPVVFIARPGTYGSSGDHRKRRQPREFHAINGAVSQLKQRYAIKEFVLLGHSGGATAAAALLTLGRNDVRCAVLTSGAFDLLERARRRAAAAGRQYVEGFDATGLPSPYDPLNAVDGIRSDSNRRIYMFGNSMDVATPFDLQKRFASAVIAAGHHVEIAEVPALAPRFHDLLGNVGLDAAASCSR